MNIKQCETFLRLVEEGSISKAAQKMFFSKQGLSRAIQSLENELGVQLFLRTSSGITLSHDWRTHLARNEANRRVVLFDFEKM